MAAGQREEALKYYGEGLDIMRKLAAKDKDNAELQDELSVRLDKVGDTLWAAGDRQGALKLHREGLDVMRKLVAADKGNTKWQDHLAGSLERVGRGARGSR